jgi:hypothetical protein
MKRLLATVLLLAACGDDDVPGTGGDIDAAPPVDAPPAIDAPPSIDAEPPLTGDILPQGAISFFRTTACPEGWTLFTDAAGRTILPSAADLGLINGLALANVALRPHPHLASAQVDLPSVSYVGVVGGGNGGVTGAGVHGFSPVVQPAIADLPFVQLLVCKKLSAPRPGHMPAPSGLLVFTAAGACPSGWKLAPLERRFLVGLPPEGVPGATFGGPPFGEAERTRTHTHGVTGELTTSSHGIALASGCCGGGYGKNGTYPITGTTDSGDATPPYIQLASCQKE